MKKINPNILIVSLLCCGTALGVVRTLYPGGLSVAPAPIVQPAETFAAKLAACDCGGAKPVLLANYRAVLGVLDSPIEVADTRTLADIITRAKTAAYGEPSAASLPELEAVLYAECVARGLLDEGEDGEREPKALDRPGWISLYTDAIAGLE
jgi:hypothetical protein